ncbi:MAG TPA: helix-turn-helix domain-containing protein [Thermodesulfobacteriota bacterium]|nr:helix-turn-helix domain-containing protein [Thermodesulfobacteriota bacterium]
MRRGRKPLKELCYRDRKIVNRINTTPVTMSQLAKKHGVSKQRIHQIVVKAKGLGYVVSRPKFLARHHRVHQCEICSRMMQVAEEKDLITKRQLSQLLGIDNKICNWHLGQLKREGFVSKKFATLRSERLVIALQYYKQNPLSASDVGKKFGYRNFYSLLSYQRKKGIDVGRMLNLPIAALLKQEDSATVFPSTAQIHS